MFEEICLVCGRHLDDNDSRAYCSEECQNLDTPSPALSSASSAVSSPNTGHAFATNIPNLVPSVLASALSKYSRSRHNYSVSSSSASSTSWSLVTDDEDVPYTGRSQNYPYDGTEYYEDSPKHAHNFLDTLKPSALSYARRPSGTNYRSTVPNPKQPQSRSTSAHVRDVPRSAPLHSHLSTRTFDNDDLPYSDVGFSSRDESESEFHIRKPSQSSRPKRNRASLPAYFSLLQISTHSDGKRISPVSSSSGNNTLARPSPPTPKIPLAGLAHSSSTIYATPRGRRRTQGESRSSRYSEESGSRSPPRSRTRRGPPPPQRASDNTSCLRDNQAGDGCLFAAPEISRGRPTVRRNSSPPPNMVMIPPDNYYGTRVATAFDGHVGAAPQAAREEATWTSGPVHHRNRGRATADVDVAAPGFGHGRSGLLDRKRRVNRPL